MFSVTFRFTIFPPSMLISTLPHHVFSIKAFNKSMSLVSASITCLLSVHISPVIEPLPVASSGASWRKSYLDLPPCTRRSLFLSCMASIASLNVVVAFFPSSLQNHPAESQNRRLVRDQERKYESPFPRAALYI